MPYRGRPSRIFLNVGSRIAQQFPVHRSADILKPEPRSAISSWECNQDARRSAIPQHEMRSNGAVLNKAVQIQTLTPGIG